MEVIIEIKEQTAFLKVVGDAILENINVIDEKLMDVMVSGATKLDIDFSECIQVSGTFIHKLLSFRSNFLEKHGEVEIVKCSKAVNDLFCLIKLDKVIRVQVED